MYGWRNTNYYLNIQQGSFDNSAASYHLCYSLIMKANSQTTLNGIHGWLLFFTVFVGIGAIIQLVQLPSIIIEGNIKTILHTILLIFIASLAFILILLRKRAAKFAYILFIIVFPIGGLLVRIFLLHEPINNLIGTILFDTLVIIVVSGYFLRSKRVNNTLID